MIDCPTVKHTHITKSTFCSKQTFLTDFQMQFIDYLTLFAADVFCSIEWNQCLLEQAKDVIFMHELLTLYPTIEVYIII